jgi:hypothetical protein
LRNPKENLVLLARRLRQMRLALAEAGDCLPMLSSAVTRMEDATKGLSKRIRTEMEVIEARLAGVKRVAADLAAVSDNAEQVKAELERQIRNVKRIEAGRLAAIPRELAEPKGLAERLGEPPPIGAALAYAPEPPPPSAPPLEQRGQTISISMI